MLKTLTKFLDKRKLQLIAVIIFCIAVPSTILGIATYHYAKDLLIKDAKRDMIAIFENANGTMEMLAKLVEEGKLTKEEAINRARETMLGPKLPDGSRDFSNSFFKYGEYGNFFGFYVDTKTWTPKFLLDASNSQREDQTQSLYSIPNRDELLNNKQFPKNYTQHIDYILSENDYYQFAGEPIWKIIINKVKENDGYFEKNIDPLPGTNPDPNDEDYFSKVYKKLSYINFVPSWSQNEQLFGSDNMVVLVVTGFDFEMLNPIKKMAFYMSLIISCVCLICLSISYLFIRRKKEAIMAKQESREILMKVHESINQIKKEFPNFSGEIEVSIVNSEHNTNLNDKLDILLKENKQQFKLIQEKNKILEQYSSKIEELTIQEERNRINRELHDTIGHTFTALTLGLENIKCMADGYPDEMKMKLDSLTSLSKDALENVRKSIHQSHAAAEDELLSIKMQQITSEFKLQTGIDTSLAVEGEESHLPSSLKLSLIRCLQESLTNAARHGNAKEIRVSLQYQTENVTLAVEDNGMGNDKLSYGFGLKSMKDRMRALQGQVTVNSAKNGTKVLCSLPLDKEIILDQKVRVLLADDQELIRESLSILLNNEKDMEVSGTCKTGAEVLQTIPLLKPDVILMDIHMPELDGIKATKAIKEQFPDIKVIILTTLENIQYATEAIQYGAEGYLLKSINPKKLADSIRLVWNGSTLISKDIAALLINQFIGSSYPETAATHQSVDLKTEYGLTDREIDLLYYLAEGYKYKTIAEKMDLSENTVKNYISQTYSKLNVKNRMQAVKILNER